MHTQPPYNKHGLADITNEQDGIYYTVALTGGFVKSNIGKHLMLNLIKGKQFYPGRLNIVLNSSVNLNSKNHTHFLIATPLLYYCPIQQKEKYIVEYSTSLPEHHP